MWRARDTGHGTHVYPVFVKTAPGLAGAGTVAGVGGELLDEVDQEEGVHGVKGGVKRVCELNRMSARGFYMYHTAFYREFFGI